MFMDTCDLPCASSSRTQPTFTYMAHEANHAPLEVPAHYIRGSCLDVPATNPSRRMLCGMMVAGEKVQLQ
jgi:hypothetical protein